MSEKSALTPSVSDLQRQIGDLQAVLQELRPDLVAAEQRLSEQLAEISAFEFLVRSRLEPLSKRLDRLTQEINELQDERRRLRESYLTFDTDADDELYQAWRSTEEAGAAAGGEFRYHEAPTVPPKQALSADQAEQLKSLYRQLARRFHPDFALNVADRAYRTSVMMAINAAYTAADIARLEELLRQPEPQRPEYTDEDLVLALLREVDHCRQRIAEIEEEIKRLANHPSCLLKQRVDRAQEQGRDLLEELAADLRDKVASKMVQRDVLQAEIEGLENGELEFSDEALADAVFNLGLEHVFTEDDDRGFTEWRDRNRDRIDTSEIDFEDEWEALRKARDRKRKGS